MSPNLYVIAGPNGAGKTTFAKQFLPNYAECREFVNADLIAGGISPFSPESAAIIAGRLMLERIKELANQRKDFGFETTLSGKAYAGFLKDSKKIGYRIHILFLWVRSVDIALERVSDRVKNLSVLCGSAVKKNFEVLLSDFDPPIFIVFINIFCLCPSMCVCLPS